MINFPLEAAEVVGTPTKKLDNIKKANIKKTNHFLGNLTPPIRQKYSSVYPMSEGLVYITIELKILQFGLRLLYLQIIRKKIR
jgi:hypothetical protein